MDIAAGILDFVYIWGIIGGLVALAFLTFGIDRIDEDARGAYMFRVLIVPGVLLIWPLVLWRWWVLETGRDKWPLRHAPPRRSHSAVWIALAVLIPAIFISALVLRPTWPAHIAPERLEAPIQ
ncbi:MAG: hypothetical protein AAF557_02690 [Pseudomonadota bacterium]